MLAIDLKSSLNTLGQGLAQTSAPAPGSAAVPITPAVILLLCVIAGVGTVLLLPGKREASIRKIGAVVLASAGLIFAASLLRWTSGSAAGHMGVYFWLFSTIALVGAVRVITHTKPVYSALYFVLTVFATAGLFVLLWAEFMAAALVLVYAGAILVTYVFVIMLAAQASNPVNPREPLAGVVEADAISREPLAACLVGFTLMGVMLFVIFDKAQAPARLPGAPPMIVTEGMPAPLDLSGPTQSLGIYLFDYHLINLELAGLILTIAMVGAIVIARKRVLPSADEFSGMIPIEEPTGDIVLGPATPVNDNPHSIPVVGTMNPRQKVYPEK